MRTLEEYVAMIPTAPPDDIERYLDALGRKPFAVTSYRCISRDDAESRLDCEDFRADLRPSAAIRPAALWCSECESWYLAEYVPAYGAPCSPNLTYQNTSGVQVVNVEQDSIDKKRNGETMVCPLCGAQTQLRNVQELRYGRAAQDFIVVPTVAENCLVLTQWCIERHMYEGYRHTERNAINAFVVDGRRIIKLSHYQYNAMAGSWRNLGTWVQRAKLVDDIGCPKMYAANLPDLGGTGAENAKLWEYMEQSNAAKTFYPVAYLRLYFKHPNVENLVTAGLGNLVGDGINGEMTHRYYTGLAPQTAAPKLEWVGWKEKRPAQMLGMTKQELRTWREYGLGVDCLRTWKELDTLPCGVSFRDLCAAMKAIGAYDTRRILREKLPMMRTINYIERQEQDLTQLEDYWRMAAVAGCDLNQDAVRWPKDLRTAHDRMSETIQYERVSGKCQQAFAAMTARCAGLTWEHDGICIRPAETPLELIREGSTLHHCVGRYSDAHARGRIILFVRHTRRPERSWYTLNIDVTSKREIQLHGYGNEFAHGKKLKIPRRVREFVDLWEREVLAKWQLPPEQKAKKKKNKATQAVA